MKSAKLLSRCAGLFFTGCRIKSGMTAGDSFPARRDFASLSRGRRTANSVLREAYPGAPGLHYAQLRIAVEIAASLRSS